MLGPEGHKVRSSWCGGAGAGMMSVVWPGTGTVIGYNAADLAISLFVIGPLADQYFGSYPPPIGPAPAALDGGALDGDPGTALSSADDEALRGQGHDLPDCGNLSVVPSLCKSIKIVSRIEVAVLVQYLQH